MSFSVSKGDGGGTAEAFGCKNRCAGGGGDGGFGCSGGGSEDGRGRGGGEARSSLLRLRFLLLLRLLGGESAPKRRAASSRWIGVEYAGRRGRVTFRVLPSASLTGKTRVTPLWSVHESSRIPVRAMAFELSSHP